MVKEYDSDSQVLEKQSRFGSRVVQEENLSDHDFSRNSSKASDAPRPLGFEPSTTRRKVWSDLSQDKEDPKPSRFSKLTRFQEEDEVHPKPTPKERSSGSSRLSRNLSKDEDKSFWKRSESKDSAEKSQIPRFGRGYSRDSDNLNLTSTGSRNEHPKKQSEEVPNQLGYQREHKLTGLTVPREESEERYVPSGVQNRRHLFEGQSQKSSGSQDRLQYLQEKIGFGRESKDSGVDKRRHLFEGQSQQFSESQDRLQYPQVKDSRGDQVHLLEHKEHQSEPLTPQQGIEEIGFGAVQEVQEVHQQFEEEDIEEDQVYPSKDSKIRQESVQEEELELKQVQKKYGFDSESPDKEYHQQQEQQKERTYTEKSDKKEWSPKERPPLARDYTQKSTTASPLIDETGDDWAKKHQGKRGKVSDLISRFNQDDSNQQSNTGSTYKREYGIGSSVGRLQTKFQ